MRQNLAPGTRRGVGRPRDLQVERPGPPSGGAGVRYLAAGAQLSFSRLRLVCKPPRESVNVSTYALSANRLCESCQRPRVPTLLRPPALLSAASTPGCGLDVGTAGPIERGLGAEGRQVQATFWGESRGEAAAESALCRGPLRGVRGAGLSRLLSVRTVVGLRSESRGRKEKRHRPQARVGARSTSRL